MENSGRTVSSTARKYKCTMCKEHKTRLFFAKDASRPRGFSYKCKDCAYIMAQRWWQKNKPKARKYGRDYYARQRKKQNDKAKAYRIALRLEFISEYGGRCTCCGESNWKFLTVEHLQGGGGAHSRSVGGSLPMLCQMKRAGWPKDLYTVLCYNCNMAKAKHGGICPHKETA